MHRNEYSGNSSAPVVQARDVHGDIIVNHVVTTNAHVLRPLWLALLDATVELGGRRGVRVAPNLVLTNGDAGPVFEEHSVGGPCACVSAGLAEPLLVADGGVPGSPVLNWRTGAVCGVLDENGGIQALTDVAEHAETNRANHFWLDRLSREQVAAGGWLHPGPELRRYLKAVAKADHEHQYEPARRRAPRLSEIYLQRQAVRQPHQDDSTPDRISADRLTEFLGAQVVAVPGAGKSSLVRHLAAQSAKTWLEDGTGGYVPVPITAEALTHGKPLPDALAEGVSPVLSHSLDLAALVTLLRDEPLPGVPWLVLVDALDEVPDVAARAAVTRQVHDHRQDGTYRFLVTSRPIDRHEMVPLFDRKTSPTYLLELFSDDDLAEFVLSYLKNDRHPDPLPAAEDLLDRVGRTKLADLAKVPLFATMLCDLYTRTDGIELPENQTQLYQQFMKWQLTKLHDAEVLATLRTRLAGWGPDAERAITGLVVGLRGVVEDIAHGVRVDGGTGSPLDLVVRATTPDGVDGVDWSEAVAEVLRLSGLFVQYGARFEYGHPTYEEFFAASRLFRDHPDPARAGRLLRPRLRWPWPDLQVKVFLVALWMESGKSPHVALRTLLQWPYRKHNIGFLAALAAHGLTLPEDLKAKAVKHLERMVRKNVDSVAWHQRADWLRELDPVHAVVVLEGMAIDQRCPGDRRYEALRFLIGFAPGKAVDATFALITDRRVSHQARRLSGDLLHEKAPAEGMELFERLAGDEGGDIRLYALDFLFERHPQRALDVAGSIVADFGMTDDQRSAAVRVALRLNRPRGQDLLCELIKVAESDRVREQAMDTMLTEDRRRLEVLLDGLKAHGGLDTRFGVTMFLVRRLEKPTSLMTDLVDGRDFPPERRVEAALLDGRSEAAKRILVDVVDSFDAAAPRRLWAIEQLVKVAPEEAAVYLAAVVHNERQPGATRLEAVMVASKHVTLRQLVDLYEVLVRSTSMTAENRLVAAEKAMAVDRSAGKEMVASFAKDKRIDVQLRMSAAAALGRGRFSQAEFEAYESIADDPTVLDLTRVRAAKKAQGAKILTGGQVLRKLVHAGLDGEARLELARALDQRDAVPVLEKLVDDRNEGPPRRMEAAKYLLRLDVEAGKRAMSRLADDTKLSSSLRNQARMAAR